MCVWRENKFALVEDEAGRGGVEKRSGRSLRRLTRR